ncbi:M15 family metallopeptidase [Candidatus Gracilibacteria bacterium]|nr:M15 family metallopeptidase [Thermales bacterium]NJL96804.1 M15 family metallopeptidase [Candidatus Gracilibacteria bacterium]
MQKAAKEDGVEISIVSGYRSVDNQQDLFASRFEALSRVDNSGQLYDANEIVSGKADNTINKVLEQSSVPGYSKHHTGYTIDINQNDGSGDLTSFGNTDAYKWVSANNYFNAKRFGFVPSYPSGAKNVGPEPEPWEYVWVGTEDLKN